MTRKLTRISAKISTMPRPKTEAAAHLEMYKLLVEKQRLQQELQTIEQRRQQILDRLSVLDTQVAQLSETSSDNAFAQKSAGCANPLSHSEVSHSEEFNTLFLEY
jgi:hypothetical protein